jgi:hypothetical protein
LIGQIVLTPGDKRGEVHAELRGELFGILEFANPEQNQKPDDVMTKGVAGPRNQTSKTARLARAVLLCAPRAGDFILHQRPARRASRRRATKSQSCP